MTYSTFINMQNTITASFTSGSQAIFYNAVTASVTSTNGKLRANLDNSLFFINGVYVRGDYIFSMNNSGSNILVIFDTGSLQYDLETDDAIVAIGKFNII